MTVLGIDPGLARTGWAFLGRGPGGDPRLVDSGLIETSPSSPLPRRLKEIHAALGAVLAARRPAAAAVEELFFLKAAASVRATLQARGVILLALAQAGLEAACYDPRSIKAALTGSGRADKRQMQRVIQRVLGLERVLSPDDVADAAAAGLCHLRLARLTGLQVLDAIGGGK